MKRSVILTDCLGPDILLVLTMKRQVLHREHAHLKVPGSWEISENSLAFLDIKVSISGKVLHTCTSMHYKPTDSPCYLLY